MSYSAASSSSQSSSRFDDAIKEIKEIEKKDSVLTSKQQIDRLLRPGSTYSNLNPFDVLQLEHTTPIEEIKKKYKRLSILVHPDKNQEDKDRAQTAFEIVNRAWKILENDVTRKKCLSVYEEAKERTDLLVAEKRKKLKKEGRGNEKIPEDDPEKLKHSVYVMVMKLFADMERKRQQLDLRDQEERKRKRETEIEEEEAKQVQKEFAKNFEESRQERVNSWHDFQSGKKKKQKKSKNQGPSFNPPKVKAETRHHSA